MKNLKHSAIKKSNTLPKLQAKPKTKPKRNNSQKVPKKISEVYKKIRMNNDFFHQLVESIEGYAVITTDTKGIIGSWNSGAEKIFQYKEKEVIGKNISIIFTPEDNKLKKSELELIVSLKKGKAIDERWHIKKDKSRFWGSGLLFPILDDNGVVHGFTKVLGDKTIYKTDEISQARLTDVIQNAPAFICILRGKNHTFEFANDLYNKLIGYRDIKNKTVEQVLPEVVEQGFIKLLDNVFKTGKPFIGNEVKALLPQKKGGSLEEKYVNFVYQPIKEADGSISGIFVHGIDVTDQVVSRRKVEENEERFRTITNNISQLAWMTDATGWIFWYNKRWFDYTGTTLKEMEGWGWKKVHHPDHLQRVIDKFTTSLKTGEEWEDVFPLRGKDGIYRWFLSRAIPIRDEKGKILHWFGTNTDITELRETEEKVEYQKSLLEAQLEVSPVGVVVVSPDGKILTYNKRFAEMWKFPKDVLESQVDRIALEAAQEQLLYPEQFLKRVLESYENHKQNHEKLYFKDGRIFERYGSPVLGKDTTDYGYVWFFLDHTEREKLTRQKDDFLGIASHELKTPVTSIKAYAQLLEKRFKKAGDSQSVDLVSKMNGQLNKLTSLIGDLLDVTKIESGRLQFNEDYFDFKQLANEVVEEIQRTTEKHTIIKKFGKTQKVYGDRDRIGQVLTNLLTNAIKYSPHTNKIVVHTSSTKKDVELCVEDFGVGISKEKQPKVFERFYRVSGPREDTFPGLGLGLYISSEIIKRQGGKIWVESGVGKGSTFCFRLPKKRSLKRKKEVNTLVEEEIKHE